MNVHAFSVVVAALCLIGIGCQRRKPCNKLTALAQDIQYTAVFRIFVIRIACKNSAGHFIHDIRRRSLHNHVFRKVRRQIADGCKKIMKFQQLLLRRQFSKQKKVNNLGISCLIMTLTIFYQVNNIITTVKQLSRDCNFLSVLHFITYNITNPCKANANTCTVRITQATHYIVFFVQIRVNRVIPFCQYRKFF